MEMKFFPASEYHTKFSGSCVKDFENFEVVQVFIKIHIFAQNYLKRHLSHECLIFCNKQSKIQQTKHFLMVYLYDNGSLLQRCVSQNIF